MISLDNGPADGDYVRYIDALVKASVSTSAATLGANATMPVLTTRAAPTAIATDGRLQNVATSQARSPDPRARRAQMKTDATAAVANAVLQRAGATDVVDLPALGRAAVTVIAGLLLASVGAFMHPVSVLMIIAGIVIVAGGVRSVSRNAAALARAQPRRV